MLMLVIILIYICISLLHILIFSSCRHLVPNMRDIAVGGLRSKDLFIESRSLAGLSTYIITVRQQCMFQQAIGLEYYTVIDYTGLNSNFPQSLLIQFRLGGNVNEGETVVAQLVLSLLVNLSYEQANVWDYWLLAIQASQFNNL